MPEVSSSRYRVDCTWDDVPHLDETTKAELLASYPPHMREARSAGVPSLGSGAIYPVPLSDVEIEPFEIPAHWPRVFALDVGWNKTAALWGALDRSSDTVFIYSEHYQGKQVPMLHAKGIKARGAWIPGVIDPASGGAGQDDGQRIMDQYKAEGLVLTKANNSVEAGLYEVWQRLETGRLRFFNTLQNLKSEYRYYRRDENGKIVKKNDHLCDCLRYLIMSGLAVAKVQEPEIRKPMATRRVASAKGGW